MQINLSEILSKEGKYIQTVMYEPETFHIAAREYPILEKKPVYFEFIHLGEKKIFMMPGFINFMKRTICLSLAMNGRFSNGHTKNIRN